MSEEGIPRIIPAIPTLSSERAGEVFQLATRERFDAARKESGAGTGDEVSELPNLNVAAASIVGKLFSGQNIPADLRESLEITIVAALEAEEHVDTEREAMWNEVWEEIDVAQRAHAAKMG
jgi:hypothetical protein